MEEPGLREANARSRKVSAMSPLGSATVLAAAVLYDCAACLDLLYLTGTVPSSSRDPRTGSFNGQGRAYGSLTGTIVVCKTLYVF